ncbi:cGAS-like receptor 1 isoform X3 [Nomia melanderi]|uniref:cGAS-like receptor 1 isoform X3 n=1 Tax=Nomia melanderi TaxID=2448451 RepID=UPI0013046570|nr:uncharacterized protein LOC116424343 isoform X3 [Nomia melanderi]
MQRVGLVEVGQTIIQRCQIFSFEKSKTIHPFKFQCSVMDDTEVTKYLSDDKEANIITKMFISLKDEEIKRNNYYLNLVIEDLIKKMKEIDDLFAISYKKIIFCGSFYKNTKVGKPNEFDLNVVLSLPIHPNRINLCSTQPGYVKIQITDSLPNTNSPKYNVTNTKNQKRLRKFINNGYLNPHQFRSWIEGILTKANSQLPLVTKYGTVKLIKIRKSGPAFTLYRNKEWFAIAVAKDIHGNNEDYQWRCSFCYQENEILARNGRAKVVIRLIKKLRDTQNWHCIASYFIETLFLNKLEELKGILNNKSITQFFYLMLKEMHCAFEKHKIEYFWDKNYNLLGRIGKIEMMNISCTLCKIIKNIERLAKTETFKISKYILTANEFELFQQEYNRRENIIHIINNEVQDETQDETLNRVQDKSWCIVS